MAAMSMSGGLEGDDLYFIFLCNLHGVFRLKTTWISILEAQKAMWKEVHFQSKRLWSPTQRRNEWRGISASLMRYFLETVYV
ncbi:hypothetical protein AA984_19475 [Brevibacillus formosus]|uniref:Uncharacterized protein n=1 Tax=Brevibacillus formosus TaxID=54913 RepID=A0A837KIS5_9BACL|nr:hypothetical protein AA984_19475 [Brevibacillus formosus]GED60037.1 hypothetical protein BFO01nite_41690 [Brevibacillus formosus]